MSGLPYTSDKAPWWMQADEPASSDCWAPCLLACSREDYAAMCTDHYDEIVGGAA